MRRCGGRIQDARGGVRGDRAYRYVQYVFVGAYWAALLGSCHLVAIATPQPSPLAVAGKCPNRPCTLID